MPPSHKLPAEANESLAARQSSGVFSTDVSFVRFTASAVACAAALLACSGDKPVTPEPKLTPTTLEILSASTLSGEVGLTYPLMVKVSDANGNGIGGVQVSWHAPEGDGSTLPSLATTDDAGAAMTRWTLGTAVGSNQAKARVTDLPPVTFTASATPGAVKEVVIHPSSSTILPGQEVQFTATGKDMYGNSNSAEVTWWSSAPRTVAIDNAGLAVGRNPGTATISAKVEGSIAEANATVGTPLELTTVSAGPGAHACGLDADGRALCWGRNESGELGTGRSSIHEAAPQRVAGSLVFSAIATGSRYSCGLTRNGEAYCWGSNEDGTLGDRTTTNSPRPVRVDMKTNFESLSVGSSHACGLTSEGKAYCWGHNRLGELGNGTAGLEDRDNEYSASAQAVTGDLVFRSITVGSGHTCGLTRDGSAYCWGSNNHGKLGTSYKSGWFVAYPVPVSTNILFKSITAGGWHTCAIAEDDRGYCWGGNPLGQLGNGTTSIPTASHSNPQRIEHFTFESLSAGYHSVCGVTLNGNVYCWGDNSAGQLGTDEPSQDCSADTHTYWCHPSPAPLAGRLRVREVSAGGQSSCTISLQNVAYCWGKNSKGKLGNGTLDDARRPVAVGNPG